MRWPGLVDCSASTPTRRCEQPHAYTLLKGYTVTHACAVAAKHTRRNPKHSHTHTHIAPGNATFCCPCLVRIQLGAVTEEVRREIRSDKKEAASYYLTYNLMYSIYYYCIRSPYFSLHPFPISQSPRLSPPCFVCKIKAPSVHWNFQATRTLIYFGMQQTPKAPFFIWLCLLRRHLKITSASFHSLVCPSLLPPWGSERFSRNGRQSTVCSIAGGERDIKAILQWFPKWYLSVWVLGNNAVFRGCW